MIPKGYKTNFETLLRAAAAGHLALLECTDRATGKPVMAVCAMGSDGVTGGTLISPLAKLFDGNPYEELNPPSTEPVKHERFPTEGIYECEGLASSYYMNPADEKRFRYIRPAYKDTQPTCVMADCWIVDARGHKNPGTRVSPVPIALASIGRRVA